MAEKAGIPLFPSDAQLAPSRLRVDATPVVRALDIWASELQRRNDAAIRDRMQEFALEAVEKGDFDIKVDPDTGEALTTANFTLINDREVRGAVAQYLDVFNDVSRRLIAEETADEVRLSLIELRQAIDPRISPEEYDRAAQEIVDSAVNMIGTVDPTGDLTGEVSLRVNDVLKREQAQAREEFVRYQRAVTSVKVMQNAVTKAASVDDYARRVAVSLADGTLRAPNEAEGDDAETRLRKRLDYAANLVVSKSDELRKALYDSIAVADPDTHQGPSSPTVVAPFVKEANDRMVESFLKALLFKTAAENPDEYLALRKAVDDVYVKGKKHERNRLLGLDRAAKKLNRELAKCVKKDIQSYIRGVTGSGEIPATSCIVRDRPPNVMDIMNASKALRESADSVDDKMFARSAEAWAAAELLLQGGKLDVPLEGLPLVEEHKKALIERRAQLRELANGSLDKNRLNMPRVFAGEALPNAESVATMIESVRRVLPDADVSAIMGSTPDQREKTIEAVRDVTNALRGLDGFEKINLLVTDVPNALQSGLTLRKHVVVDGKEQQVQEITYTAKQLGVLGVYDLTYEVSRELTGMGLDEEFLNNRQDFPLFDDQFYQSMLDMAVAAGSSSPETPEGRREWGRFMATTSAIWEAETEIGTPPHFSVYQPIDAAKKEQKPIAYAYGLNAFLRMALPESQQAGRLANIIISGAARYDQVKDQVMEDGTTIRRTLVDAISEVRDEFDDVVRAMARSETEYREVLETVAKAVAVERASGGDEISDLLGTVAEQLEDSGRIRSYRSPTFGNQDWPIPAMDPVFAHIDDDDISIFASRLPTAALVAFGRDASTFLGLTAGRPAVIDGRVMFIGRDGNPITAVGPGGERLIAFVDVKKLLEVTDYRREIAKADDKLIAQVLYLGTADKEKWEEFRAGR